MASAYLFHIVKNHAFMDGNKRTPLLSALVFLDINGVSIDHEDDRLYELTLAATPGFPRFVRVTLPGLRPRTTTWSCGTVPATLGAMAPKNLLDAALALPPEERLELASQLLASVEDGTGEEWTEAWLAECDARVAAAESGAEASVPWNEAHDRLRARLAHR